MPFLVHIKQAATGETRVHREKGEWDDAAEYGWSDGGNFSCDCNRALAWTWAAGGKDDPDVPCGEEAYLIRVTDESGTELYRDHNWETSRPPMAAGSYNSSR